MPAQRILEQRKLPLASRARSMVRAVMLEEVMLEEKVEAATSVVATEKGAGVADVDAAVVAGVATRDSPSPQGG